jgi:hypothetical protein
VIEERFPHSIVDKKQPLSQPTKRQLHANKGGNCWLHLQL